MVKIEGQDVKMKLGDLTIESVESWELLSGYYPTADFEMSFSGIFSPSDKPLLDAFKLGDEVFSQVRKMNLIFEENLFMEGIYSVDIKDDLVPKLVNKEKEVKVEFSYSFTDPAKLSYRVSDLGRVFGSTYNPAFRKLFTKLW